MKPDWFRCEKCLWWESYEHAKDQPWKGDCHHTSFPFATEDNYYCENWTCANCLESWNRLESKFGEIFSFLNHNKCQEVKVEE